MYTLNAVEFEIKSKQNIEIGIGLFRKLKHARTIKQKYTVHNIVLLKALSCWTS